MPDKLRSLTLISTAKRSRQPARSIWERIEGEKEGEEESSHFQSLFAPVLKDQKISFKRPVNSGLFFFELAQYCRWRCNNLQVLWLLDPKNCLTFPNFKQSLIQEFLDGFLSEIINISLTGSWCCKKWVSKAPLSRSLSIGLSETVHLLTRRSDHLLQPVLLRHPFSLEANSIKRLCVSVASSSVGNARGRQQLSPHYKT